MNVHLDGDGTLARFRGWQHRLFKDRKMKDRKMGLFIFLSSIFLSIRTCRHEAVLHVRLPEGRNQTGRHAHVPGVAPPTTYNDTC
jgi:hypothetical protein